MSIKQKQLRQVVGSWQITLISATASPPDCVYVIDGDELSTDKVKDFKNKGRAFLETDKAILFEFFSAGTLYAIVIDGANFTGKAMVLAEDKSVLEEVKQIAAC